MPLDKSRIQGFGSDGTTSGSSGAGALRISHCPQGHALKSWAAIQGWCDKCGRKVFKGEKVMDCRQCNWYVCTSCCPQEGVSSRDYGDRGDFSSAFDNFASQLGDAIDAAAADIQEMANDVKDFVVETMGLGDDEEEDEDALATVASKPRKQADPTSVQHRQLSNDAVSKFCNEYPVIRVAPKPDELEALWKKISHLQATAIVAAIYDQLGYSSGEVEWQPRLRVLYLLEWLHKQGGAAKEMASSAAGQTDGLLQHLLEVQQCKEKASRVILMLLGKAKASEAGIDVDAVAAEIAREKEQQANQQAAAKAAPAAKKEVVQDLLDVAAPPPAAPAPKAKAKAAAKPAAGADLMDLMSDPSPPVVAAPVPDPLGLGDLFAAPAPAVPATAAAPVPSPSACDPFSANFDFNPSAASSGPVAGALGGAAPGGGLSVCGALGAGGALGTGVANGPVMAPMVSGYAALGKAGPYPQPFQQQPPMWGGEAGGPLGGLGAGTSGGFGGGSGCGGCGAFKAPMPMGVAAPMGAKASPMGMTPPKAATPAYSIPAAKDLPSLGSTSKDPFAFVTEHTGLGPGK